MKHRIDLLIVDTHRLLRECLELALTEVEEIVVLDPAVGWEDAVNRVKEDDPDVVLINCRVNRHFRPGVDEGTDTQFPQRQNHHVRDIEAGGRLR